MMPRTAYKALMFVASAVLLFSASITRAAPATMPSHLGDVRAAVLGPDADTDRARELSRLFDEIDAERSKLAGDAPHGVRMAEAPRNRPLQVLLDTAISQVGISVPAAVLFDTRDDDYVRQAALGALVKYDGYSPEDLPLLCRVLQFVANQTNDGTLNNLRSWIPPQSVYTRLWPKFTNLVGMGELPADGPLSVTALSQNPKEWLRQLLTRAATAPKQMAERRRLILACLVTLDR